MVEKFRRERSANGNEGNSTNDTTTDDKPYSRVPADDGKYLKTNDLQKKFIV